MKQVRNISSRLIVLDSNLQILPKNYIDIQENQLYTALNQKLKELQQMNLIKVYDIVSVPPKSATSSSKQPSKKQTKKKTKEDK